MNTSNGRLLGRMRSTILVPKGIRKPAKLDFSILCELFIFTQTQSCFLKFFPVFMRLFGFCVVATPFFDPKKQIVYQSFIMSVFFGFFAFATGIKEGLYFSQKALTVFK